MRTHRFPSRNWTRRSTSADAAPLLVLLGGIIGGIGGFGPQVCGVTVAYSMNIGRRCHRLPQFIPVMFETTVLGAALTAFFGMSALNKLRSPITRC